MFGLLEGIFWLFLYVVKCCVVYRIGRFVFNLSKLIFVYYLAPRIGLGIDFRKYKEKWTVITGPTDGIGKQYLYQLASKGLRKFLLISRDSKKLSDTSKWLLSSFSDCEIRTHAFTFGRDDYNDLRKLIEPLDVGILVNNAGCGYDVLLKLSEDPQADRSCYHINTGSVFEMMEIVLPKLRQAKSGAIVNVSSVQSVRPIPLLTSYSASKAFVSHLTTAAQREYRNDGITIQCLIPILVDTKMMQYSADNTPLFDYLIVTSPEKFAAEAINTLGVTTYTTGCAYHDFQLALVYLVPWWLLRISAEPYYRTHQKRMLKEQNKKMQKEQ